MIAAAEFVTGKRPFLDFHPFLCPLLLAGLLLPAAASAQVTYTGTAATQNFGSQAIGSPSAAQALSFSVPAGNTVGSIAVLTKGAPNLDFTEATGSTCTAKTYSSAATCTVNVTFKPRFAGERYGAVVFFSEASNTGTVLGSVLIYGTGAGPEAVFSPATLSTLGGGFSNPYGVAVDGSGNVYVANASVNEMPPGCASSSCVTTLGGGFGFAQDVAVDGSGNVYVADWGGSAVYEMPPAAPRRAA
jgi:streptogramin lyase